MRILGLIPARGGSKGIPRKNVRDIAGRPLIAWTIESALRSRYLTSVVVSTDDEEIAAVAKLYGAEIPFMRPSKLAMDDSPTIAVVRHALEVLRNFDAVVLLQPTSPLRSAEDIDACVDLARAASANAVVSVSEAESHPAWTFKLDSQNRLQPIGSDGAISRRQELPVAYSLNGAVYFMSTEWLPKVNVLWDRETIAYVMPRERSIDVDTQLDWRIAEMLLRDVK